MIRIALAVLALAASFSPLQRPKEMHLKTEDGMINVVGFDTVALDEETGGIKLLGGQGQVTVEDTGRGLTMWAKTMTCTIRKDEAGNNYIDTADLIGAAHLKFDSEAAAKAAEAAAVAAKKPAPKKPDGKSLTELASDEIKYAGDPKGGTVTMPKPLLSTTTSEGVRSETPKVKAGEPAGTAVAIPFHQVTREEGSQGTMLFSLAKDASGRAKVTPKSAHLDGPVKIHLTRTENPPAEPGKPAIPSVRNFDATGDRFDADFEKPEPTLTLAGNVVGNGDSQGMNGTVTCDQAIITLNPATLQPRRYEFIGDPTKSRMTMPPVAGAKP